jgi:hypothetical protein
MIPAPTNSTIKDTAELICRMAVTSTPLTMALIRVLV